MSLPKLPVAEWVSRLVQIPSVNPDQAGPRAGLPGEARLAAQLAEWFRELGGEVTCEEPLAGRPNVYAIWRGSSDRWIAVDAHMDTVSVETMTEDPFSGRIADGRVYGRGATDTKATLGVVLALLEAMQRSGVRPEANLLVAATIDEEVGASGAPALAHWMGRQDLVADEMVVAEPTQCRPIHGHKGIVRIEFRVQGQTAHSSQPQAGKNAIAAAARLAVALEEENEGLQALPSDSLGPPMLTVTLIHGGTGINVVPDACSLSLDRRVSADEKAHAVTAALRELAERHCPLPFTIHVQKEIDAFWQSPETPWVRQLANWSGEPPTLAPYCTNAWAYHDVARECVVLGPGSIDQAHGDAEWVEITELEKLAGIYARWWGILEDRRAIQWNQMREPEQDSAG
jgi:acetylornithine deacetylase/succinyl-diaminopimelate desuccinylase-like protein